MTDLNSVLAPGYGNSIYAAGDIDDLGRITGQAFDPGTGAYSAFLAVPQRGAPAQRRVGTMPEHLRRALLRRLGLAIDDGDSATAR
jgi:hypothetical protein